MTTPEKPTIAVLGNARMAAPIARNLLRAGFGVSVCNRTFRRTQALVDAGARLAASPADAAHSAEVMLTMLADGEAVSQALTGPEGALAGVRPGTVWIQMAKVGVDWTERLARHAWDYGLEFVDASRSGSDAPARGAQLVVVTAAGAASGGPELPLAAAPAHRWELTMPARAYDDLTSVIDEATAPALAQAA
jgi:3-hydroxyisobutyrate dehydrogenase